MITVDGVTKRYGGRLAVDDLSFTVAAGRVTGFVGPNGAGKSTTMRAMVGLTRPDGGEVRYGGVPYTRIKRPARVVGSVLDARCMHPGRTARDHLRAMGALSGISSARVDEVLADVGLTSAADQRAGGFSLGMRQRLALAGALLGEPEVLLLDEPSNGLDPDGIRWLRRRLSDFAGRGGTVFVSSHLIGELSMFADDLIVVGGGRLLAADSVAGIMARSAVTVTVETPDPSELVRCLRVHGLAVERDGDRLFIHDSTKAAVSRVAFDNRIHVIEITETSRPLEDTLLELTRGSRPVRLRLMTIERPEGRTMTTTTPLPTTAPPTRSGRDDLEVLPRALRSEWIKLTSLRANKVILGAAVVINVLAAWSVATFVTDEVLTVADVFVFPAVLTAALAAIAAILVFTSESQHGTLAVSLAAQPARWVMATTKMLTAAAIGSIFGAAGMVGGAAGATLGGLEKGDTAAMVVTALWAVFFTAMAALLGLGVGMVVRHSAAAISGLLVWWFVAENLIRLVAPPKVARLLPFDAGYRVLEVGSDLDTPAILAVALSRPQLALVFTTYAALAVLTGSVLLHRRDCDR